MSQRFTGLGPAEQLAEWKARATDPRPRAASGLEPLDDMLNRRSFGAGELVILGGRMHTRKTGVVCNIIVNMLQAGVPVGLVGLDEHPASYVMKLASVMSGIPHTTLGENWDTPKMAKLHEQYRSLTAKLSVTRGYRPDFGSLSGWLETAEVTTGERPRVVVIDYLSLLARAKFQKGNAERVQNLAEDLQVWTNDNEVTTIALHQVGRQDDTAKRYHGDSPMTPEQLMYGGEQAADIILSTFRPSMEPIGNMTEKQALAEGIDQEEWEARRDAVQEAEDLTYLQLTKNRPGVELRYRGFPLRSFGQSQRMEAVEDRVDEEMRLVADGA